MSRDDYNHGAYMLAKENAALQDEIAELKRLNAVALEAMRGTVNYLNGFTYERLNHAIKELTKGETK
jgi:hypothetical protein